METGMMMEGCDTKAYSPRQTPVDERLEMRKKALLQELDDVNQALEALKKNPEFLSTLNLLRRVGI